MSAWGAFIAGTDTGVGKTRVTVALLRGLGELGVCAAGMKAVASGTDAAGFNEDVERIRAASAASALAPESPDETNPYCFPWPISPHLAAQRAGVSIETARVRRAYGRLAGRCEAVLVEGTGGWLAPIGEQETMADVARSLGLPVVLVVGVRLGCLNHALLTARVLAADGVPLAGWIGSVLDGQMPALEENLATLEQRLQARYLGLLPFAALRGDDRAHLRPAACALQAQLAAPARAPATDAGPVSP